MRNPVAATASGNTQHGFRLHVWGEEPIWQEMPRPYADDSEVLVQVEACGVGLTVLNALDGELSNEDGKLPIVPGHEFVGKVIETGSSVSQELMGRRIVAYFYLSCGVCPECMETRETLCRNFAGFVGVHRDGGYAPYVALPAFNAIPVSDELDPVAATVVPDAVATSVHICRERLNLTPYDRMLVIGAGGGVGIHLVQVARLYGAQVAGLEVTEEKLDTLEGLGVMPVRSEPFSELELPRLWPDGNPTVVVDLVGLNESLNWSVQVLAAGGTLVSLTPFKGRELRVDPRLMVLRELSVVGSRYASRAEVSLAAELVLSGRVRPIIGERTGPDGVPSLHRHLRKGTLLGRGALEWNPDGPVAPHGTVDEG